MMEESLQEKWLPVPEFPLYEVSDLGNVRSWVPSHRHLTRSHQPKHMKLRPNSRGYPYLFLNGAGTDRPQMRLVHKLVAHAFLGPPEEGQVVRHKDDNPANNALTNLFYGTYAQNSWDSQQNRAHVQHMQAKRTMTDS